MTFKNADNVATYILHCAIAVQLCRITSAYHPLVNFVYLQLKSIIMLL